VRRLSLGGWTAHTREVVQALPTDAWDDIIGAEDISLAGLAL
jgi:hypothetical protein